jgi:hypothetical protein
MNLLNFRDLLDIKITNLLNYKITNNFDSRYSIFIKLLLKILLKVLIRNIINLPSSSNIIFKPTIFNNPRIPKSSII